MAAGVAMVVIGAVLMRSRAQSHPNPLPALDVQPTAAAIQADQAFGQAWSAVTMPSIMAPASVQAEVQRDQQGYTARVTWKPVSGAAGYEVWQWRPGEKTATFVGKAHPSQTEMTVRIDPGMEQVAYSVRTVGPAGIRSEATSSQWVNVPRVQRISFSRDQQYVGTIDLPAGWVQQLVDQQGGHWVWGDPQNPGKHVVIDIVGEPDGPPRFQVAKFVDPGSNQKPMSPYSIRWSSYALQAPGYLWQKQATVGGACSDLGCSQAMVVSVSMPDSEANEAWQILDSVRGGIAEARDVPVQRIAMVGVKGETRILRTDVLKCEPIEEPKGILDHFVDFVDKVMGGSDGAKWFCFEDLNQNGNYDITGEDGQAIRTNDYRTSAYQRPETVCPPPLIGNVTSVLDGYRIRLPIRLVVGDKVVETTAIIDTGAPFSLFPRNMLAQLGYQPDTSIPHSVTGVAGGEVKGYTYSIRFPQLWIDNRWWLTGPRYDLIRVSGADGAWGDILLGQDFLARSGIKLEIQNGQWTLTVPCHGAA